MSDAVTGGLGKRGTVKRVSYGVWVKDSINRIS